MFLSCLFIDTGENPDRPRPGRLWLRNLYHVHQRLCMGFPSQESKANDQCFLQPYNPANFSRSYTREISVKPGNGASIQAGECHIHAPRSQDEGFLFRIDPRSQGRAVILVQSSLEPDWKYAFQNTEFFAAPPVVKPYNPDFQNGITLRFRLVANATRKICTKSREDGTKNNGTRVPVARYKIEDWLTGRAEKLGFTVQRFTNIQTGYFSVFKHNDNKVEENVAGPKLNRLFYARYDGFLYVKNTELFNDTIIRGIGPAKGFGFGLLSVAPIKQN